MQTILRDLKYGVRILRKNSGITLIAIITLSLGIGASTTIFSIINGFFFRPLSYKEPKRLVVLKVTDINRESAQRPTSQITFKDLQDSSRSFEQMAGIKEQSFNLSFKNNTERLQGAFVTSKFLQTLGVEPFRGRVFRPEDSYRGAERVVVLHYKVWQRSFGGNPNLIGESIKLNAVPYTVIGIMPENFESYGFAELWISISAQLNRENAERELDGLEIIARLGPGVSLSQAQSEMKLVADRFNSNSSSLNYKASVEVVPLREFLVEDGGSTLPILLGAVIFVLLIACSNVANLLLSQATTRHREMALRAALGASRAHLIRQLLIESLILTLISSALGTLLAYWAINAMVAAIPVQVPLWLNLSIDVQVLCVTLLTSIVIGLLLGLVPALRVSKPNVIEWIKEGSNRSSSYHGNKLRNLLVISETVLAVILLSGAGLLTQSFIKLSEVDLGYNPQNLITMDVELPELKYPENSQITNFSDQVLENIKKTSGVKSVAISAPMNFANEGVDGGGAKETATYRAVTPEYFKVMDSSLLTGRSFTNEDMKQGSKTAIVNQYLAQRYWPRENPVGKSVKLGGGENASWLQVIGVIEDVRTPGLYARGVGARTSPQVYLPYSQNIDRRFTILARTTVDPLTIVPATRKAVHEVDSDQPVHNVRSGEQALLQNMWFLQAFSILLRIFALLGTAFVSIGIYGIISYSVEQRRNEIGIRMALGAQSNSILKMITWHGIKLVLIGISIGLPIAWLFARVISGLIFNVSTVDPLISVLVLFILLVVALTASLVPVRRALKIAPVEALRHE